MATFSVGVYKNGVLLGTGTADSASAAITSYSGAVIQVYSNVQVQMRAGTNLGGAYNSRILAVNGATLTGSNVCNFA